MSGEILNSNINDGKRPSAKQKIKYLKNFLFKTEDEKSKKLKSNDLIEKAMFVMKMSKNVKYDSALEDVEKYLQNWYI